MGSLVITHPFHPLTGQRLEVLFTKRRDGAVVFVCADGASGQVTLPKPWTDRGEDALSGRLSVEGLAALDTLMRSVQGRNCSGGVTCF